MGNEVKRCCIVSGAPEADPDYVKNSINPDDYIIAADSGYKLLDELCIVPDVIVADFDSSDKPSFNCEIIIFPVEKEATDTFNAVKLAVDRGFNDITILNALGGRLDHTYSNILCLDYCRKNGVSCRICSRRNRISLIDKRTEIKKEYGWFSLFAFLEDCEGVKISGAHYDAGFYGKEKLNLKLSDQFAQSNYIEGESCTVSLDKGCLLLIESND